MYANKAHTPQHSVVTLYVCVLSSAKFQFQIWQVKERRSFPWRIIDNCLTKKVESIKLLQGTRNFTVN